MWKILALFLALALRPAEAAIHHNPALRVTMLGPIEEPASFAFCMMIVICELRVLGRLADLATPAQQRAHGYPVVFITLLWAATFASAAMFHFHETRLTEAMDYFSGFGTYCCMFYFGAREVGILGIRLNRTVALPLLKWALYGLAVLFTWQMLFVKFDYGWAVLVMGSLAACHFAVWLPWCAREILAGNRNAWRCIVMHVLVVVLVPLELYDFAPLLRTFDGHSLWHGGGVAVAYLWGEFLVRECARAAPGLPTKSKDS